MSTLQNHSAPKMTRPADYKFEIANLRKNSCERLCLTLEEYRGRDLFNLSVVRDSSGAHDPNGMGKTLRCVSIQVHQLPALVEAMQDAERRAVARACLMDDAKLLDGFQEFWECIADNRGKQKAIRIWKRDKLYRFKAKIITAARLYASDRGDDRRFWKMPQGWLNDYRWMDETDNAETSIMSEEAKQRLYLGFHQRWYESQSRQPHEIERPPYFIWPEILGPPPTSPRCRVDACILSEFGYGASSEQQAEKRLENEH